MEKAIALVAGEPNSISSEIIFKSWLLRKKFKHKPFFIIGNINLLNKQKKKLKFSIKIKEINENFKYGDLKGNRMPVINVKYSQKQAFKKISSLSNKYIYECFDCALRLIKLNKLAGLVNCPISKEYLLKGKYKGITEYLSAKTNRSGNEVMIIYNSKLAVSPITTHIPIKNVSSMLNKNKIIQKIKIIHNFYKEKLKRIPKIGVLGLNPHNHSNNEESEEKKIIKPAIKTLKKNKLKIKGPISPDTSFLFKRKLGLDVIIGMYHDQVLTTIKALYGFDSINITLGLKFIRVSPDHGVGEDITGKRKASPVSLIQSIKFFNLVK